jgi:hypothetical protein
VSILEDDGSLNELLLSVRELGFEVANLEPNTTYLVKVRARSPTGAAGPWSPLFKGRTLKLGKS